MPAAHHHHGCALPSAFCTPPLVVPELVFCSDRHAAPPRLQVKLRLDEPLLRTTDLRKLMSACAIADTLIERVQKLPHASQEFDVQLLQQIEQLCLQVDPTQPAQDLLQELGMLDFFPYLAQVLHGERLSQAALHQGAIYLNYVSLMNQVVMMGTQLYHDACVPQHHKYTAHQIALLYQSLNMLQGNTKPMRRLIEARFDEIKVITESKNPIMDIELSSWLQEIAWLCREEMKCCPDYVHKRLSKATTILRARS